MAHSNMASSSDYLIQDQHGKIIKVIQHSGNIKEESSTASGVYSHHTSDTVMNSTQAYNQSVDNPSRAQFIRLHNFGKQESSNQNYSTVQHASNNSGQSLLKFHNYNNVKYVVNNNQSTTKNKPAVQNAITRRRKPDKIGRGLRHFSMKVCEKVREKGSTTYNEVADELVHEEVQTTVDSGANCDQKNIRRRVYDALNVLMAMNIISKDKKEIKWIGLPTTSMQQCLLLEKENQKRRERIEAKHQQLKELLLQQVAFKSLVQRNKEAEKLGIIPAANSSIQLPFIIVNTHKSTKINCSVSNDKSEYYFKFNDKFEIHDDVEVLKRMGLLLGLDKGDCSNENVEKAKNMVPTNFEKYIESYAVGQQDTDLGENNGWSFIDNSQNSVASKMEQISDKDGIKMLDEDDIITESSDID